MSELDREQLGELLSAYLDNGLDDAEARAVERIVAQDAAARRMLDELRRTTEAVATLPRHQAPPSVLQEIQSRLEREQLLGEVEEPHAAGRTIRWPGAGWLSAAAVLALMVVGGFWLWPKRRAPGPAPDPSAIALAPTESAAERVALAPAAKGRREEAASSEKARRSPSAPTPSPLDDARMAMTDGFSAPTLDESDRVPPAIRALSETDAIAVLDGRTPLHMRLTVADDSARAAVLGDLNRYAASKGPEPQTMMRLRRGQSGKRTSASVPTMPGPDAEAVDRVVLRVPVRELGSLAERLRFQVGPASEVALSAGPARLRGWDETRAAFAQVRRAQVQRPAARDRASDDAIPAPSDEGAKAPPESAPDGENVSEEIAWLADALSAVGVDRDRVVGLLRPKSDAEQKAGAEAEPPTTMAEPTTAPEAVATHVQEDQAERDGLVERSLQSLGYAASTDPAADANRPPATRGHAPSPYTSGDAMEVTIIVEFASRPALSGDAQDKRSGKTAGRKRPAPTVRPPQTLDPSQ